jgi:hypothetical protein
MVNGYCKFKFKRGHILNSIKSEFLNGGWGKIDEFEKPEETKSCVAGLRTAGLSYFSLNRRSYPNPH